MNQLENRQKRKWLWILLLLPVIIVLTARGCFYHETLYEYEGATVSYEWGEVRSDLVGTFSKDGDNVIQGSPYNLFIIVEKEMKEIGSVQISSISFIDENNKIAYENNSLIKKDFSIRETDKSNIAALRLSGIVLKEYIPYKVIIKFTINTEKTERTVTTEMFFEKDFKEDRWRNKLFDMIMSV